MKISKYLALGLLVISLTPVWGQPSPKPATDTPALTKFNLDFSGGTPTQLVKAIEKAMGKPLNVIIPTEDADVQLPPLKMNDVDVAQLFKALEAASIKQIAVVSGTYYSGYGSQNSSYSTFVTSYGFKTEGKLSDNSVWYFHADKPSLPPMVSTQKICRFYSLAPYLSCGFTVDDITTAIQTGWKMSGDASLPQLNYHKETKLLIAFGEPGKLDVIDTVLKALQPLPTNPTGDFQERLRQTIKNQSQGTVPAAPPMTQQRIPPIAKPPEVPAAGQ
jgi:hypothetical protein